MSTIASLFPDDYKEHEYTRVNNDRELADSIDELKSAENIESLERFAKAYLGMFLDMNNMIPPNDRIDILANPDLAKAVRQGFTAIIHKTDFPSPAAIADTIEGEQFAVGYILLAALDFLNQNDSLEISALSSEVMIAAICFHFGYKTEINDQWLVDACLSRPGDVVHALIPFWHRLIEHGTDHLPGLAMFIGQKDYQAILHDTLIPVLSSWQTVNKKTLSLLLRDAFRFCDHPQLLATTEQMINTANPNEPQRYVLWLAAGFLLNPDQYRMNLLDYCGRAKEKIIRLLDFVFHVLSNDSVTINAAELCTLLRIIAPKITPQEDRYGQLCDNSRKVLYLFYRLAINKDSAKADEVEKLTQVRVMKLYQSILNFRPDSTGIMLDAYIQQLLDHGLIKRRVKRYD